MSTVLKRITAEAKRIRKRHPNMQWKTAVKDASRKYRSGTIRKKSTKSVGKIKHRKTIRRKKSVGKIGKPSVPQLKHAIVFGLGEKIGALEIRKAKANRKRDKNKIQKQITEIKREMKIYI